MSFLTYRDVSLSLNGKEIFCNQLSLSQEASLDRPIQEGEVVSTRSQASAPKRNSLSINYYLTGKCPLKDYIFTNHKFPLTGLINNGVRFNQGYLESYRLSAQSNSPVLITAQIAVCDEISGNLVAITPSTQVPGLQVFNYNDSYFSNNDLNITNFSWNFTNTVEPIYYQKETGLSIINPDRVHIGQKEISADFISDSQDLILGFTGDPFSATFTCKHPSLNISEEYAISGLLNKKDFNISTDEYHQTNYSVTQNHINEEPKISSITTSSYPSQNYITIQSPNLSNGYFSSNNNFNLVEKVILGDRELNFTVNRGASFDTITGIIPVDAINGSLSVHTTKGLIVYPTQVNLNFSGVGVSGFWPETGNYHDTILISGSNFHRITNVFFNGIAANFNVYDNTGLFHKLIANVPDGTTIGNINVVSFPRNVSGASTGNFYPILQITGFTATGTWSGNCIIEGHNFSGITNVYFNNVRSPSFTVSNNKRISATIPGTGAGYTKGYIKLSGYRGMSCLSSSKYQPIVRITGVNLISGGVDEDVAISGIFDPQFLYPDNGGFRLSFGSEYSIFYRNNNFTLTGLIPTGFFGSAAPALYEPDGIGKYPPFTGNFIQISNPIITNFLTASPVVENGNQIGWVKDVKRFSRNDLVFQGQNFNYFFNIPYSVIVSGHGQEYYYNDIQRNSAGTQLIAKNIRITGAEVNQIFTVYVRNYAGHTIGNTWLRNASPDNLAQVGSAIQSSDGQIVIAYNGSALGGAINGPAGYAIDSNLQSASMTAPFGDGASISSGWLEITFTQPVNFGAIKINNESSQSHAFDNYPVTINGFTYVLVGSPSSELSNTGSLQCFDSLGNSLLLTGVSFLNDLKIYDDIVTGVKRLKLFRNDNEARYLRFSDIAIYD